MNEQQLKNIVEGALLAAGRSLSLDDLQALFEESARPDKGALKKTIDALHENYAERGIEIKETSSGFRIQVKQQYAEWVSRLWEERPTRYSRALLETLALVAYRQPITRAEIEDVRGVSVSTSIVRTLQERDWIRVVGHRDVPGRPAMYGTTKTFLDYFGLKSLDELPTLAELRDIDSINVELDLKEHGGDMQRKEPAELAEDDGGMPVEVAMADEAEDETVADDSMNDESFEETPDELTNDEATDVPQEEITNGEDVTRH
ncbi:MAG TPA: SMC-Scp complex subunit ScpB [Gammaproteobacteria bacterium]